jgi:hypothetical protein
MPNRHNANCFLIPDKLVDDAEGANSQRAEPLQPPAQCVADQRFALEQPERVPYRIDEWPVELEQLTSSAPCKDDPCHRLLR